MISIKDIINIEVWKYLCDKNIKNNSGECELWNIESVSFKNNIYEKYVYEEWKYIWMVRYLKGRI